MASTGITPGASSVTIESTDTALCIIPPKQEWASVDRLRILYDKSYEKWPPHLNLVYPFVKTGSLPTAAAAISLHLRALVAGNSDQNTTTCALDAADVFPHRRGNSIFIYDSDTSRASKLQSIRLSIFEALKQSPTDSRLHMTVGQSNDLGSAPHEFLLQKAGFIPPVQWVVEELAILVREKTQINRQLSTRMNLWGTINLRDFTVHQLGTPSRFYEPQPLLSAPGSNEADSNAFGKTGTSTQQSLCFSTVNATWEPYFYSADGDVHDKPDTLSVATYNVLAEFHYPPSRVRYPLIVSNLLDPLARSDVLVLQEVTDDFLCFLLSDPHIRKEYPFVSNGPPDQLDIDPLPSHLNIVALSKWSYTWEWVPFQRRHKGSLVLRFDQIGDQQGERFFPTVLSTIHLTCGLTDGSVTAKQTQLQAILRYLSTTYHSNPWILAGDFNITTSACAINAALEKRSISPQGHDHLIHLDTLLSESGLLDTWTMACLDNVISPDLEDSQQSFTEGFEGEAGATFDPITNELAAAILGTGMNNRPQRYDRILIKPGNLLSIGGFNMFGKQPHVTETGNELQTIGNVSYASDHWGVRCSLKLQPATPVKPSETQILYLKVPTLVKTVSASLADASAIRKYLLDHQIYPSATDHTIRENALELLRSVLNSNRTQAVPLQTQPGVQFVVVPVGSYGLGTWTASSDVDCLCIGPISSKTFFALAAQKFRKAASEEFKVLRRVNALSGTMLELDILGIKMDLHYCPSALIAETWPRAMYIPVTSPVFALPAQILAKLKPARDMYYLRRTMPDSAAFRTACHLIKTWAKQHGIYAARFGYLGGIHIAVLLATICKSLSRNNGPVPLASIILTFFNHYANFDWQNDIVFDPFFHKSLRYVRTSREPMVILGYHSPGLNVATAASQPSVRTIAEELKRANRKLSTDGMTWDAFLRHGSTTDSGSAAFVKAYISFLKIDVQFWGASLAKGSQYVGWLESRCVMLLVDIGRRLPKIHARIWPARFVETELADEETDYQGCYLIGLDTLQSNGTVEEHKITHGSLLAAIQKFEDQIKNDEKYFDPKSCWMSVSIVRQPELRTLKLDHREWGEHTIGDDESDDEEDDEDMTLQQPEEESDQASTRKHKGLKKGLPSKLPNGSGVKLRPSSDVLHRLRWDSTMGGESEYLVGYRDRFLGIMERPLNHWKAEQTDEEFIPQHRIMYFKRISDGALVWDRLTRTDDVFGSGITGNGVSS